VLKLQKNVKKLLIVSGLRKEGG